jgi:hypothetical protein
MKSIVLAWLVTVTGGFGRRFVHHVRMRRAV